MIEEKFKFHIIVIGCTMNVSDAERLEGVLCELGMTKCSQRDESDVVIVMTCGVRKKAEDRMYGIIPRIKKYNPKCITILAGCLSKRKDVRKRLEEDVDIWLDTTDMVNVCKKLAERFNIGDNLSKIKSLKNYLSLQPKYASKYSAYVPIGNGCNNWCTYCVVPKARGPEVYRAPDEVLSEVRELLKNGYKEITLIAQNVDSYKYENNDEIISFARLLDMVNGLGEGFWVRFLTSHPKDMSTELISVIKNGNNICKHIHLPVQSGNNDVLTRMNRKYTREHYIDLIKNIREELDGELPVSISTDFIVGYPGESDAQFKDSAELMREVGFDMAYVSRYSPRPDTASYLLPDDIDDATKKKRDAELMKIVENTCYENNLKYLNKEVLVLATGVRNGNIIARTSTNKNVRIKKGEGEDVGKGLIGRFIAVRIVKASNNGFVGDLL